MLFAPEAVPGGREFVTSMLFAPEAVGKEDLPPFGFSLLGLYSSLCSLASFSRLVDLPRTPLEPLAEPGDCW